MESQADRLERLMLLLVRSLQGHVGGIDEKGNAANTQGEVLARIEKELQPALTVEDFYMRYTPQNAFDPAEPKAFIMEFAEAYASMKFPSRKR